MKSSIIFCFLISICSFSFSQPIDLSYVTKNLGLDKAALGGDTILVGEDWKSGSTKLNFVGDANIQNSVNNGQNFVANTGLGIIYDRFWYGKSNKIRQFNLYLSINVASTADSIIAELDPMMQASNRRDFGSFLLIPNNTKQSASLEATIHRNLFDRTYNSKYGVINWLKKRIDGVVKGYIFNVLGSTSTWSVRDTSYNMAGLSLKGGFFYEFISDKIRHDDGYSIKMGAMLSSRFILGDLNFDRNSRIRKELLNSDRSSFWGVEFFARFKFRNVIAQISIPLLGPDEVEGLTKSQFVTSIQFIGGFPLNLKKTSNSRLVNNALGT